MKHSHITIKNINLSVKISDEEKFWIEKNTEGFLKFDFDFILKIEYNL